MSTHNHLEEPSFPIKPNLPSGLLTFFHSQLFITPPYPNAPCNGQTIIITGSNTGLGLEAARHFYRLNCARLILAVRDIAKGQAAKESIIDSVRHRSDPEAIEIWGLDLSTTASTVAFAEKVKSQLDRVGVLIENAGINPREFRVVEGYEQAVQVNVLNTFLLGLLVLPKLHETKRTVKESEPHLVIVSSEAHRLTSFPEINAPDLYAKLNEEGAFSQQPRYQATKLMEVLFTRELVARLNYTNSNTNTIPNSDSDAYIPLVIINMVNPGLCTSNLDRSGTKPPLLLRLVRRCLDRTTEVGSRTFVLAASAPVSSHGEFQSDGGNQDVEGWIYTDVGRRAQGKVFEQTMGVLEGRVPGIANGLGL